MNMEDIVPDYEIDNWIMGVEQDNRSIEYRLSMAHIDYNRNRNDLKMFSERSIVAKNIIQMAWDARRRLRSIQAERNAGNVHD